MSDHDHKVLPEIVLVEIGEVEGPVNDLFFGVVGEPRGHYGWHLAIRTPLDKQFLPSDVSVVVPTLAVDSATHYISTPSLNESLGNFTTVTCVKPFDAPPYQRDERFTVQWDMKVIRRLHPL